MPLPVGTRLGSYEIVSPLGTGGMGEVFRARDNKLGRDVALKVLPESFVLDPDRLARFQREAQVLAALNHPNIAGIYGVEDANGIHALVLELVEGETLADRIARGRIPLDDALPIARQLAEALEAAHEQGIIHRDLKPANIKVRPDGTVKVLDFGLAKTLGPAETGHHRMTRQDETNPNKEVVSGFSRTLSESPTLTSPVIQATLAGVILGTAAYMSPEQAKGHPADKRSDLWSFGCVLFEMLTGKRACEGEDTSETLAAVLRGAPDWTALPADAPEPVRRLLRRCLVKDRKARIADASIARIEIDEAQHSPDSNDTSRAESTGRPREWMRTAAAVMFTAVIAVVTTMAIRQMPASSEIRLDISAPPTDDPISLAISPDGTNVVFAAPSDSGTAQLWLRSLKSVAARLLPGTEGASFPFWSPDNRSIGFDADGKLKRIDLADGAVRVLANRGQGGGTWNRDGVIVFAAGGTPLLRVSQDGGNAVQAVALRPQQTNHRAPQFLPDGQHFLYFATGVGLGVYVGELDRNEGQRVVDTDAAAAYSASGHLLFVRQGTLYAQSFDTARLQVRGDPLLLAEHIAIEGANGYAAVSASAAGPIAYRTGSIGRRRQFVRVDRSGNELQRIGEPLAGVGASNWSLSPDGKRIALLRTINGNGDIWLLDARGALIRITSSEAMESWPVWSPDGTRLAYQSRVDEISVHVKALTGGAGEQPLLSTGTRISPRDWSSDGRHLLYNSDDDLWATTLERDAKPVAVATTKFAEHGGQFSPDARWVAYESDESGRVEVYAQSFPAGSGKTQVSSRGGAQPSWSRDGKELFYIGLDERLMAVPLTFDSRGQTIEPGVAVPLFRVHVGGAIPAGGSARQYAVSPDGRSFLIRTVIDDINSSPITVILNWHPPAAK
jgi:eukaryotic-like serine/threonine-protein kinase